jgi:DNA-binding IclR family transcriptional regulator
VSGSIQSVERAAAILRLLAESDDAMGLLQIAAALDLAKGTAHGLLSTLAGVGFVEQSHPAGPYRLSDDMAGLSRNRLDINELRSRALNWADALASRSGEAVKVAVFRDGRAVVAHHVFRVTDDRRGRQRILTGSEVPLHATGLGKVLLAFEPAAARSIVGRELSSLTYRTITERVALYRELAGVRDLGWAAAVDEAEPETGDIAAPVRDRGGYVVAVVGIEGAKDRICDERGRPRPTLVSHVVRAGRDISRELGHGRGQ